MNRPRLRVRSVVGLALSIAIAVVLTPTAAQAATGAVPASAVPATHRCENFGFDPNAIHRAGHCATVDDFVNSTGSRAERGQGQAFCQVSMSGFIVQCAGISQRVTITDLLTGETQSANFTCGRYGGGACPADRFENTSPGIFLHCDSFYVATVRTTIVLPVSAVTSRSDDFDSGTFSGC